MFIYGSIPFFFFKYLFEKEVIHNGVNVYAWLVLNKPYIMVIKIKTSLIESLWDE